MAGTKDGELSILTKQRKNSQVDSIENMDCTLTDHSSSDQECQCGELLKLLDLMLDSEDITAAEEDNKLGSLTESRIPSSLNITEPTQWKFQTKEETTNSE
jgi:hypothetical protein